MTESATAAPASDLGAGSPGASEPTVETAVDPVRAAEVAKQERLSKVFLQSQRAKSEALAAKREAAAEREALAQERAAIAEHKARIERFRSAEDPTELLDELGIDFLELNRRIAESDTVEGKLKHTQAALRAQAEEFKKYIAEQKAEREKLENETKSQAEAREMSEAASQFTAYVTANEERYPYLSLYDEDRIAAAAVAAASGEYQRTKGRPHRSGHDIADYLEELASQDMSGWEKRKAQRASKATVATPTGASPSQQSPSGTSKLQTLTNKAAASIAASAPTAPASSSFEERRASVLAKMKLSRTNKP